MHKFTPTEMVTHQDVPLRMEISYLIADFYICCIFTDLTDLDFCDYMKKFGSHKKIFLSHYRAIVNNFSSKYPKMVMYFSNPSLWEVKADW